MKYYMIVTGKGKERRIIHWYINRKLAILRLNYFILDRGIYDARLITTSIQPPENLRGY